MNIKKISLFILFCSCIEFSFSQSYQDTIFKKEIFTVCDQKATFPGGAEVMRNFITANMKYPDSAKVYGITAIVWITMIVDVDGTILFSEIVRGDERFGFNTEALRLISIMPKWNSGYYHGRPVASKVSVPIRFGVSNETDDIFQSSLENGLKFLNEGKYFEAIVMFDTLIARNPEIKNGYYNRGLAKFKMHDTLEACMDWKAMLNLKDSSVWGIYSKYCLGYSKDIISKRDSLGAAALSKEQKIKMVQVGYKRRQDSIASVFRAPHEEYYFQASMSVPTGAFGDQFKINDSDEPAEGIRKTMEGKLGGFNAKSGYEMEAGGYFYFNDQEVPVTGGMRVTFLAFSTNPFRWHKDGDYIFNDASYKDMNAFSIKIGPCLRSVLINHQAIRYYYQIGYYVNHHAQWIYDGNYTDYYQDYRFTFTDNSEYISNSGAGFKHELGIMYSYRNFTIGAAYNFGTVHYNNVEFKRKLDVVIDQYSPFQNSYQYLETDHIFYDKKFEVDAPTSYFLFSVGYKL